MKNRWYDQTPEDLAQQLNTNLRSGLSKKEAAARLRRYGKNEVYPVSKAPFRTYLLHIVTDFLAILLILSAILSAAFSESRDSLGVLAVMLFNYLVTIFTYVKAQRVLERMGHFSLPQAKVVREGKLFLVEQESLVPGDIISVSAGDIVPCDARLIRDDRLMVMESGICHTDKPTRKNAAFIEHRTLPPEERRNMLYASTIVTEGKGRAIVCETGEDTLVCVSGKNVTIGDHDKLKVVQTIRQFCSRASLLLIAGVFILSIIGVLRVSSDFTPFDIYLLGLALTVSDMTELASAFTYVIVASGIFGAVKRERDVNAGALIKNPSKIDRLKDINCLIIPKECLYSEQDMTLDKLFVGGRLLDIRDPSAIGYDRCLRFALISTGIYGMCRLVANNDAGENVYTSEEDAIIRASERCGLYDRSLDRDYPMLDHISAGGQNKLDTTLIARGNGYQVVLRGSAGEVISRCSRYYEKGRALDLDADTKRTLLVQAANLSRSNIRVVAVATAKYRFNSLVRLGQAQTDLTFEGMICIEEPLVPGAAKYISQCKAAGIRVILFCRDVADNNKALAVSMGIASDESECTTLEKISHMKEDLIRTNISLYSMYEGLNNNQQRYIMRWLKEDYKCKIGILGRELDDLILYGESEIGFSEVVTISKRAKGSVDLTDKSLPIESKNAKGGVRGGCEALKFASDVIVSNPDAKGNGGFNAMVRAIVTSRNIYRNLLTMMRYLLYTQSARLGLVLCSLISGVKLLGTVQILFLGLVGDLGAVMVLAFTKPETGLSSLYADAEKRLSRLGRVALESTLLCIPVVIGSVLSSFLLGYNGIVLGDEARVSYYFITLLISQFVALSAMMGRDKRRLIEVRIEKAYFASLLSLAGFIAAGWFLPFFGRFFGIVSFPPICWAGIAATAFVSALVLNLYHLIAGRRNKKDRRHRRKRQSEDEDLFSNA